MKKLLTFAFLLCTISALQAQTLADTTKITVFDRTNQWIATGAELKAYCASGGGGSVATDAIWDAAGDLVVGTGANTAARLAMGTANQQLRVNSGGTALEYFTPSAGSGDITNGGNTTGAAVTIGTNDANGLNLETNNITRVAITGAARAEMSSIFLSGTSEAILESATRVEIQIHNENAVNPMILLAVA
jgi:hypothetical protein